jgi:hypothetical protein
MKLSHELLAQYERHLHITSVCSGSSEETWKAIMINKYTELCAIDCPKRAAKTQGV